MEEERATYNIALVKRNIITIQGGKIIMSTKITRINQIAKERPKEVFTSI